MNIFCYRIKKQSDLFRSPCEEFLLVFSGYNGDEAYAKLETLRNNIKSLEFKAKEQTFSITMTFGLAEYDFSSDIDTIIKEADEKLYMGKEKSLLNT